MKIVHSFWSKPLLSQGSSEFTGGWYERQHYYMSWALSCLQFKKYYDQVELITDVYGKQLLIDQMQLPYTRVQVVLDKLHDYHPDLWALGKIVAYSLQEESFIHADGDVFIYKRLPASLEAAPLLAQHLEVDFPYYAPHYEMMAQAFEYLPESMLQDRADNQTFQAYSAGLLGGHDYGFFKLFAKEAFALVDRNAHLLPQVVPKYLNVLYEQYLFYCLCQAQGKQVSCYTQGVTLDFEGFSDFTGVPEQKQFVHPVDSFKRRKTTSEQLAQRLQLDHPSYYQHIQELLVQQLI